MIFATERLIIRQLKVSDTEAFIKMMRNPSGLDPIPKSVLEQITNQTTLSQLLDDTASSDRHIWVIDNKNNGEFIGLCTLLKNDENDDEIGYGIEEQFWGKGYGTELTKGLINYCFSVLNCKKLTADVNIENLQSIKILDKFMSPAKEFYNSTDQCTDRRYVIYKSEWIM